MLPCGAGRPHYRNLSSSFMASQPSDAEAWTQYAIAREGCIELACALFSTQTVFNSLEKMYHLSYLDEAPIQAKAVAQQMRLQFLKNWNR